MARCWFGGLALVVACGAPRDAIESADDDSAAATGDTGGASDGSASADEGSQGPMCGDGILESEEICDDGNAIEGDGCNSQCQFSGATLSVTYRHGEFRSLVVDDEGGEYLFRDLGPPGLSQPADLRLTLDVDGQEQWERAMYPELPATLSHCRLGGDGFQCLLTEEEGFLGFSGYAVALDMEGAESWRTFVATGSDGLWSAAAHDRDFLYVGTSWLAGEEGFRVLALERTEGPVQWATDGWPHQGWAQVLDVIYLRGVGIAVVSQTQSGGVLDVYDAAEGALQSSTEMPEQVYPSVVLASPDAEVLVLNTESQDIVLRGLVDGEFEERWRIPAAGPALRTAAFDREGFLVIGGMDQSWGFPPGEGGDVPFEGPNARIWKVSLDGDVQWGWIRNVIAQEEVRALRIDRDNRIHAAWVTSDVVGGGTNPHRTGVITLAP